MTLTEMWNWVVNTPISISDPIIVTVIVTGMVVIIVSASIWSCKGPEAKERERGGRMSIEIGTLLPCLLLAAVILVAVTIWPKEEKK